MPALQGSNARATAKLRSNLVVAPLSDDVYEPAAAIDLSELDAPTDDQP